MDESIVKHLEEQKVLKLSEAIRIGARMRPQCQRDYFGVDGGSCALGAAWDGMGRPGRNPAYADSLQQALKSIGNIPVTLAKEIVRRNDDLGHTREQIADWLESQGL